jgi:IS4 transposase
VKEINTLHRISNPQSSSYVSDFVHNSKITEENVIRIFFGLNLSDLTYVCYKSALIKYDMKNTRAKGKRSVEEGSRLYELCVQISLLFTRSISQLRHHNGVLD